MNTPVNFELAKLLKEKGFDYHLLYNDFAEYYNYFDPSIQGRLHQSDFPEGKFPDSDKWIPVPYIHQVVMWLYEKYGIWIYSDETFRPYIIKDGKNKIYNGELSRLKNLNGGYMTVYIWDSPTEAYEAAIEYTLTNLI